MHGNFETNDQCSDEVFHENDMKMDLAMQIISNDKTVKSDTIQDLKEFNQQSLTTQAKRGEQLVSMMPAIIKAFIFLGDDIVELSKKNDVLKNKIGDFDKNGYKNLKTNW